MTHFILCGHGSYGTSLLQSMKMLLPEVESVSVIDFTSEMDSSDLTEVIKKELTQLENQNVLLICDLVGGAPFKISATETMERPNTGIVGGLNLAAILEIYFMRNLELEDLIEAAIKTTKESVEYIIH